MVGLALFIVLLVLLIVIILRSSTLSAKQCLHTFISDTKADPSHLKGESDLSVVVGIG